MAPATNPATPATRISLPPVFAAATPIYQARGGDDSIIRPEYGCAKPSNAVGPVKLGVW